LIGAVVGIAPSFAPNHIEPHSASIRAKTSVSMESVWESRTQYLPHTCVSLSFSLSSKLAAERPKRYLCAVRAMGAEHLLKVPRSDSDEYVLINVKKDGTKTLDLRLIATDGSDVYVSERRL